MISYDPLWVTMKKKNVTKYRLVHKCGISQSTITRLSKGDFIALDTVDRLCTILECRVEDILLYKPNK